MLPARFDPVAHARQIVYSYVPCEADDSEAATIASVARKQSGSSICAGAQRRTTPMLLSHLITLVQIILVAAIAANLGYIAAR
jgi:hypothetical protein